MAIDKEIKKKVTEEWLNVFPQLSAFAQNKLYKILGSCIIGIELIKSPFSEEYSPYFVIYSLWEKDMKTCLSGPILLSRLKNKKGFEYNIPYEKHSMFFDDVLDSIQKQSTLSFDENISLKKLISILDEYSKTSPLSAAPNSYLQAALQEAKLKIALFVGVAEAKSILEQINKRNWDLNHFKACGIDVNGWLQSLQTTIINRDEFLKQIEINKQDKKIAKLKSSELTL
ncbi:hypothetical protein [Flavobacterium pectinovorum]|uniref:hypothetical protein n=1 Tax=Flavobacterium pectinovorum TaxID=29533 RepID=UPI001FAE178E|nr:hypothetical protein [Flavobacterium pectinovorum]MCI9843340.1 hypothetical protein [Flavobacterium pectinovorum]